MSPIGRQAVRMEHTHINDTTANDNHISHTPRGILHRPLFHMFQAIIMFSAPNLRTLLKRSLREVQREVEPRTTAFQSRTVALFAASIEEQLDRVQSSPGTGMTTPTKLVITAATAGGYFITNH